MELSIFFDCRRFTLDEADGSPAKTKQTMQQQRWNSEFRHWLTVAARAVGFDRVGVAEVHALEHPSAVQDAERFSAWIDAGHAGEMDYLKRRTDAGTLLRANPSIAVPWARSVIVCAINYNFASSPMQKEGCSANNAPPLSIGPSPPGSGWIARYAWTGRAMDDGIRAPADYHDLLLSRLRHIEADLLLRATCTTRCYVDTGPLVERSLAAEAGIGWIGKNTCIIDQQLGSWLLLGVIVTSLPVEDRNRQFADNLSIVTHSKPRSVHAEDLLSADKMAFAPEGLVGALAPDRCGSCTRCIDACPTGALLGAMSPEAPRGMDASRCIAYLTIEKKGAIDLELRAAMGRQVFGCDICQDVCPWNRKASKAEQNLQAGQPDALSMSRSMRNEPEPKQPALQPRRELVNPPLDWLAAMDAREFKRIFKGSPLQRTGRKRLLRNVAIAMGNSGETRFLSQLETWATGDDPVLADVAEWARAHLLEYLS